MSSIVYGENTTLWQPARPRFRPGRLLLSWLLAAAALLIAAKLVPAVEVGNFGGAAVATLVIAVLNAIIPPLVAALRIPFMALAGFGVILLLDAAMLKAVSAIAPNAIQVDSFWWALVAALVASAVGVVLDIVFGTNDDDTYTLRVTRRLARRAGGGRRTDAPGLIFLEIDGLALPVLRRAMRDGNAPNMASWLADGTHRLLEWETDLSSQTGASQAGILLGKNDDIPAFRWVDKPTGKVIACSGPDDCKAIERSCSTGIGLLVNGGASRGNLLSGDADEVILTVSRVSAEKKANPGYRAFFANGFNVTRSLVLFFWEVVLELSASLRAARRNVLPRGHRGGMYPFLRAAVCVVVRDLIIYSVLADMMFGRPVVYATLSSYDEVAHHSGLERPDTLEALRKLDQQIGRVFAARRYAPRPYHVIVLSDHGQTQGATFKQRNGYTLEDLVGRSLEGGRTTGIGGGDEQDAIAKIAVQEATGTAPSATGRTGRRTSPTGHAVVLGSGNLGLVYLMEEKRRLTLEEIDERHPRLVPALREHPHIGWLLVHSERARPARAGRARGALPRRRPGRGRGPARPLLGERACPPAPHGRLPARRRHHGRELLRPRPGRGLRLRGADLVSRRSRRPADAAVRPAPGRAALPHRAGRRRRRRAHAAHRLAPPLPARLGAGAGREGRGPGRRLRGCCRGARPGDLLRDMRPRREQRRGDDHPDHPEQRAGTDRDDQDGERVELERRPVGQRLEEVLEQAVRQDHDHEHDQRRVRALESRGRAARRRRPR